MRRDGDGPGPPVAMSIAGSDSGGGAGIQADLRTFAALGVFGTTAVTAVTAQNTVEVRSVTLLPPEAVLAQVDAVLADLPVAAVKTGMLGDAGIVRAVAELAAAGRLPNLVVDPVLVASSGATLASDEARRAYVELLLPHAAVTTPNLPEAGALLGRPARHLHDARDLARRLGEVSGGLVVVTGGHLGTDQAVDVTWDGIDLTEHARPRFDTANTHGSGCTFAAAVAAHLARGDAPRVAVQLAGELVHRAIEGSRRWRLGAGHGPLDHFGWVDAATGAATRGPATGAATAGPADGEPATRCGPAVSRSEPDGPTW